MSHASILIAIDLPKGERFQKANLEKMIAHQMEPFDENGGWFSDGSRWDWWVIGGRYSGRLNGKDLAKRKDLDLAKLTAEKSKELSKQWDNAHKEAKKKNDPVWLSLIYGIEEGMTKEQYIASPFFFYAFLRNRTWHENERMGWFGTSAKTECELSREEELKGKCITEKNGAKIINWRSDDATWAAKFWPRFIENLDPETILAVVDYHV